MEVMVVMEVTEVMVVMEMEVIEMEMMVID